MDEREAIFERRPRSMNSNTEKKRPRVVVKNSFWIIFPTQNIEGGGRDERESILYELAIQQLARQSVTGELLTPKNKNRYIASA